MRRSLILTVAAAVSMVLLAMLVPMAVLLRSYALEDRLSLAALEVQATETVVSMSGQDPGAVSVYLDQINDDSPIQTTVLYPPSATHPDGLGVGPHAGEDHRVVESRATGRARVDDIDGGAEFLVPVSLGGSSAAPAQTPVIRVRVSAPGLESGIVRSWGVLAALGLVLLVGALVLADRLGRTFVQPILGLAAHARELGAGRRSEPLEPDGPPEVQDLTRAMNQLVERIDVLLERERQGLSDASHRLRTPITALRLRIEALAEVEDRTQIAADLDDLQATVDHLVHRARRSEREGLVAGADALAVLGERAAYWAPLAEDQGRSLSIDVSPGSAPVRASESDLVALIDVLLDNVFTHTPDSAPVQVSVRGLDAGGAALVVADGGPGLPSDVDVVRRGTSGAGSTGLGLAIAEETARSSGGSLRLGRSELGGTLVEVDLGPS